MPCIHAPKNRGPVRIDRPPVPINAHVNTELTSNDVHSAREPPESRKRSARITVYLPFLIKLIKGQRLLFRHARPDESR